MSELVTVGSAEGRVKRSSPVARAAMLVTGAGVVLKLVAVGKELVVAAMYGRSGEMDAFLIAFLIPGLLVNLFGETANQALIPTLVRVREAGGKAQAQRLLESVQTAMVGLLVAGVGVVGLGGRWILPLIATRFDGAKLQLATELMVGLLPVVLLAAIASNCAAVANTEGKFAAPALAPVAVPVWVGAFALVLAGRYGIWAMVWGTCMGTLVQCAMTVNTLKFSGYALRLRWHGWSPEFGEIAKQYGPLLLGSVVANAGLVVDQGMAASLQPGSVATLVYGNRFVSVVVTLLAGAIATAITPYLSETVARKNWQECRVMVRRWAGIMALVSVPIAVAMIAGSRMLVAMTLQHGVFHAADTLAVAPVQAMYAIQLPFFVVSRVYYRHLLAMRRTKVILACGVVNLALDVVLNLVLMRWMGVAGIALATSMWTVSTFFFLMYWSKRVMREEEAR